MKQDDESEIKLEKFVLQEFRKMLLHRGMSKDTNVASIDQIVRYAGAREPKISQTLFQGIMSFFSPPSLGSMVKEVLISLGMNPAEFSTVSSKQILQAMHVHLVLQRKPVPDDVIFPLVHKRTR